MDNLTEFELKRRELIHKIQELHQEGNSISEIARIIGKSWKTVKKYLEGGNHTTFAEAIGRVFWRYLRILLLRRFRKG